MKPSQNAVYKALVLRDDVAMDAIEEVLDGLQIRREKQRELFLAFWSWLEGFDHLLKDTRRGNKARLEKIAFA
jgi:hypothetical protein